MTCCRCGGHAVFCRTCVAKLVDEACDETTRYVNRIWGLCIGGVVAITGITIWGWHLLGKF